MQDYRTATTTSTEPEGDLPSKIDETRCACFAELAGLPPELEPSPLRMYRRVGARFSKLAHMIYGIVRQAVRQGFDGAWLSQPEFAAIAGSSSRQAQRCLDKLVELEILVEDPKFRPAAGQLKATGYARAQMRTAYALGPAALEPRRRPKPDDETRRKTRREMATLPALISSPSGIPEDSKTLSKRAGARATVGTQTQQAVAEDGKSIAPAARRAALTGREEAGGRVEQDPDQRPFLRKLSDVLDDDDLAMRLAALGLRFAEVSP